MLYEMTLEKTVRVCIKIEAEDDKEAEKKASEIYQSSDDTIFSSGDVEKDYILIDEYDRIIVDWA